MEELKFSVRKSEFDRFAEKIGIPPGELLDALKAEVVKAGPGYRYVIDLENFFFYVLEKLHGGQKATKRREVSLSEFESALDRAIAATAGASGYAKLTEVRNYVMQNLDIGEEDFAKYLLTLLYEKRGTYVLLEGGDVKIQIGAKKYGFIKKVGKKLLAEVTYY